MAYLIYGKQKGQKQFKPMNMGSGTQVNNLIFASVFWEDETPLEKLQKYVDELNKDNPDWTFEIRKQGGNNA